MAIAIQRPGCRQVAAVLRRLDGESPPQDIMDMLTSTPSPEPAIVDASEGSPGDGVTKAAEVTAKSDGGQSGMVSRIVVPDAEQAVLLDPSDSPRHLRVRLHIIDNTRIKNVGKYNSCMVSK